MCRIISIIFQKTTNLFRSPVLSKDTDNKMKTRSSIESPDSLTETPNTSTETPDMETETPNTETETPESPDTPDTTVCTPETPETPDTRAVVPNSSENDSSDVEIDGGASGSGHHESNPGRLVIYGERTSHFA